MQRSLTIRQFHISDVKPGERCAVSSGCLSLNHKLPQELAEADDRIDSVSVRLIRPSEWNCYTDTIMDVVPISTKALGRLGEGITHTLRGIHGALRLRFRREPNGRIRILRRDTSEQLMRGWAGTPPKRI